ncbi:kinase-like protein [Zopfia rhizophila CBS 207.26]|uniref:Kinase-like protein n=1 Tax=Zopfia rhizophila CBS 207.26 TaxID=1314779 RepID=A0A6A6EUR7_9PEZI|nr:kinase-like protein [Zopfia rhizophila CBS 207.26]
MANQNSKLTSLRSYLVPHLSRDTCLGFLAGGGFALTLSNCSLAVHGLNTLVEPVRKFVLARCVPRTLIICAALGFTVWARRFLLHSPRCFGSPLKILNVTENPSSFPSLIRSANVELAPRLTNEDIAQAVILRGSQDSHRKVVKVGSNMVAKLRLDPEAAEAESMTFIRNHTTIPVPRVLNTYEEEGYRYILMEFVEGELLEKIWGKLSSSERSVILNELKDYICQMRQIKCPNGTPIGSITGGPAIDRRQLDSAKDGPFKSEADFNEWQLAQLHEETPLSRRDLFAALHRTDHEIVFSHGDLAFHNIIVREGHIAAIIDWEYSGWYPEHWDYCKTRSFLSGTDELYDCCKRIFEKQYYSEYFMDEWFTREVRHGGF